MFKWSNIEDRLNVWRVVNKYDNNIELSKKIVKMNEVLTILSALCCGSLIGLSETNNDNKIVIYIYNILKGYGIISSVFSGVVSMTLCSLISATSYKDTLILIENSIHFSNIPFFGIIFSLTCLIFCTSLHFEIYIMYITLPYSLFVIAYSLYFYGSMHKFIHDLVNIKENEDIIQYNINNV